MCHTRTLPCPSQVHSRTTANTIITTCSYLVYALNTIIQLYTDEVLVVYTAAVIAATASYAIATTTTNTTAATTTTAAAVLLRPVPLLQLPRHAYTIHYYCCCDCFCCCTTAVVYEYTTFGASTSERAGHACVHAYDTAVPTVYAIPGTAV